MWVRDFPGRKGMDIVMVELPPNPLGGSSLLL